MLLSADPLGVGPADTTLAQEAILYVEAVPSSAMRAEDSISALADAAAPSRSADPLFAEGGLFESSEILDLSIPTDEPPALAAEASVAGPEAEPTSPAVMESRGGTGGESATETVAMSVDALSPVPTVAGIPAPEATPTPASPDTTSLAEDLVTTLRAANGPPTRVIAPGHSPGADDFNTPQIWSGGEAYEWEINSLSGKEGENPGWDLVRVHGSAGVQGTLDLQALEALPFTIQIKSLNGNANVALPGFDNTKAYEWRIVATDDGIKNFDRSRVVLDTTLFKNDLGGGAFRLERSEDGRDLILRFLPSSPYILWETPVWSEQGPRILTNNLGLGTPESDAIGAIHGLAVHPSNANIVFVGSVNGGVWLSTNALSASPHWIPLGEHLPSMSISVVRLSPFLSNGTAIHTLTAAQALDPANIDRLVIYVGTGQVSNSMERGRLAGLFKYEVGPKLWTQYTDFVGLHIADIAPSKLTTQEVLVSTQTVIPWDGTNPGRGGVYKTTNGGARWDRLTGELNLATADFILPEGRAWDLVIDPFNPARVYLSMAGHYEPVGIAPKDKGIFRSDNFGDSWVKIDDGIWLDEDVDRFDADADGTVDNKEGIQFARRIRLAASPAAQGVLFAAIARRSPTVTGKFVGVFRSTDGGQSWLPLGVVPPASVGEQAITNLSIVAHPSDPNVVYVGGDRPPNLYRGDAGSAGLIRFEASGDATYSGIRYPSIGVDVTSTATNTTPAVTSGLVFKEVNSSGVEDGLTVVFEGLGNSDFYDIALKTAPKSNVRVRLVAPTAPVALEVRDAANPANDFLVFTPANFATPQRVRVRANANPNTQGSPYGAVISHKFEAVDTALEPYADMNQALPTLRVNVMGDSLPAGLTVFQTGDATRVSETGVNDTLWVVLTAAPTSANVTVNLVANAQLDAVDAANPANRFLTFTPANWMTPQRVTVSGKDDGLFEADTWTSISGTGANGTRPHGDSRNMVFTVDNELIEVDDGGIYHLSNPFDPSTRIWRTLNGDLRINEFGADVAYDPFSDTILAGSQDNGVLSQRPGGDMVWDDWTGGDGFAVAIDPLTPGGPTRYLFSNNFNFIFRETYDPVTGRPLNQSKFTIQKYEKQVGGPHDGKVLITSPQHGLSNGRYVLTSGTPTNLSSEVAVVDADHFILTQHVYKSGFTGSGSFRLLNPIADATGAGVTVKIKSPLHGLKDGDRIYIFGMQGNTVANNKVFSVDVINPDEFLLPGVQGNGTYPSGSISFWYRDTRILLSSAVGQPHKSGLNPVDQAFAGVRRIPVAVNAVRSGWMVLGNDHLYESRDGSMGDVIIDLDAATRSHPEPRNDTAGVTALAYGGRRAGVDQPDVLYVARFDSISVRAPDGTWTMTANGITGARSAPWDGSQIFRAIALDPEDWQRAVAVAGSDAWMTLDGGGTWVRVTGNLPARANSVDGVEVLSDGKRLAVVVGTGIGVYHAVFDDPALQLALGRHPGWTQLGTGLPTVLVSDVEYDKTDDVLVIGTLGRGAWKLAGARQEIFDKDTLLIEGSEAGDLITLQLQTQRVDRPAAIEILIDGVLLKTVEYETVRKIVVRGNGGGDTLAINSAHGEVNVPWDIEFDGGSSVTDQVLFQGQASGSSLRYGAILGRPFVELGKQRVFTVNVEFENDSANSDVVVARFQEGLDAFANSAIAIEGRELLGRYLPILGSSTGGTLNGRRPEFTPIGDPARDEEEAEAGQEPETSPSEELDNVLGLFRRIFESGPKSFSLANLRNLAADADALEALLEGLDDVPNNVSKTEAGSTTKFDVRVVKTLPGIAALEVSGLGGLLGLQGTIELEIDVELHLIIGLDEFGFFVELAPDAELVLSNLRAEDTLLGEGHIGFLGVRLEEGSIATGADVRIEVNLIELPDDVYGTGLDLKVRLEEFMADPEAHMAVTLVSDPLHDDLSLDGDFTVGITSFSGEPLFDLGTATIQLIWPDIDDPFHLRVSAAPGTPGAALLRFLNFTPQEALAEVKRLVNYLRQLSTSAQLDVELPFGGGLTFGAAFDFSDAFLDRVYARIADIALTMPKPPGGLSAELSLGRFSTVSHFTIQIDGATPVAITIDTAGNGGLDDLVADFNAAFATAGLEGRLVAMRDGVQIQFKLLQGTSLKIGGPDPNDPVFVELGFSSNQLGFEFPKFATLQAMLEEMHRSLDPDGPGPLEFDLDPHFDLATKQLTFEVALGYHDTRETQFKYDSDIGLGDLADVSFSGSLSLDIDLSIDFTLGFDFNALSAPRMSTSYGLPPPSNGRIAADSSFTLNLNDGVRYDFVLPKAATATNTKLADLVDDLNGLLAGRSFEGKALNQVVRFRVAANAIVLEVINEDADGDGHLDDHAEDDNGNQILDSGEDDDGDGRLDINEDTIFVNGTLDSWLDKVQSIVVEADSSDPMATEIGFDGSRPSRSIIRGLFLQDVGLSAGLLANGTGLTASARFAVFELGASGTANGGASFHLSLKNPADGSSRLDLDILLKHLADLSNYVTAETALNGFLDIQLGGLHLKPDLLTVLGDSLLPPDAGFRIHIPDIHHLAYNPAPYDASTNNQGVFVTYPELGALGDFGCANYLEIIAAVDAMADQLEGLRGFGFLNQRLPLINTSIGDVLDFAGDLATTFQKLFAGDAATIGKLESDIESALGIAPDQFSIRVDTTPIAKTSGGGVGTYASTRFNRPGANNAIVFTAVDAGTALNGVTVDLVDDRSLPAGENLAEATYDEDRKLLTVRYNATYTTAAKIVQAVVDAHAADPPGVPFTAALDDSAGTGDAPSNNGSGVITETALKFHLGYGLSYGNFLPLQFNIADLVALVPDPAIQEFLAGVTDLIQLEGSASLNVTASASLALDFGLDLSTECGFVPFLYDTTGLTLKAAIRGTNLNFKVGIGALNVSVQNGTVTLDADGDPNTQDDASFVVSFVDDDGDGRHYFRDPDFFDASNIGVTLEAGASAVLPLYALDTLPLGSPGDADGDGLPDNALAVEIPDLVELFTGDATNGIVISTPNVAGLFDDLNLCDLVTHADLLLAGLDALLGTIQDGLGSSLLSRNLPLVGSQLGKAADFIGDFRAGLLADIRAKLAEVGDPIGLVKQAIFNVLGTPGLDILVQMDGVTPISAFDQIDITCAADAVHFNFRLQKALNLVDTTGDPIRLDIGIPGLGLEVDGNVKVEISFDLTLRFVISASEGFYFDTSDSQELAIGFRVTIPGLHAQGNLLFLQVDVSDESDGKDMQGGARKASSFTGGFVVDLKDPVGSGNKLTYADMTNGGFDFDKFVDAKLGAVADVNLDLSVSFGGSARFPRLVAELDVDWEWTHDGPAGGTLKFGIPNLALDIGSFVSDFIQPILQELSDITGPLQPIVDVLTQRLPVISDLANRDYTLLDLAELWGTVTPETRRFIDVLVVIVNLANDDSVADDGNLLMRLGGFNFDIDKFGKLMRKAGETDGPTADPGEVNNGPFQAFFGELEKIGITLPFLSVGEMFKLFTGKPISFIEYDLPVLDFVAGFHITVPIFGPLVAKFGGEMHARAEISIGFDTFGLQKFFASEDRDVLHIFDGFYVKDLDDDGVDVPEILLEGALTAAAVIDLVVAEAGARGGIEATVTANLRDPDGDGRVRVSEIVANAGQDLRCIFDIQGELKAFFEAYLEADLGLFKIDETYRIAEVTLLTFEIGCPEPVLATLEGADQGILRLNIGDFASAREVGNVYDGDETFVVTHVSGDPGDADGEIVTVRFEGITQTYAGVKRIYARAGAGHDTVDLRTVLAPVDVAEGVHGGPGNDRLYAGRGGGPYFGDAGDDTIVGADADGDFPGVDDEFHGGSGADALTGSDGNDALFGDEGADLLDGGLGDDALNGGQGNDILLGGDGHDMLTGGSGADDIEGGAGNDKAFGEAGDDLLDGGLGNDELTGGDDDDTLHGGPGNDVLLGDSGTILSAFHVTGIDGAGHDLLTGGPGEDRLFGAGGNDALFGGILLESGAVQVSETDRADFLDGGDGNDTVFADDAHSEGVTTFPGVNIGDAVWFDSLDGHGVRNGVRDPGEPGVPNIQVELYDAGNVLLSSTMTDGSGGFRFVGLPAGDYYLVFHLPPGLDFTTPDSGVDDSLDSDVDPATARTGVFHVDAGQSDLTRDAGVKGTTPVLTITSPSIREGDTGLQNLVFTVTLSAPSDRVVTVCYKSAPGTAERIADYGSVDYTLVFEPGVTSLEVVVPIVGDDIDERDETFVVALGDPSNATLDPANSIGIGTIVDDDATPIVTILAGSQPDPDPTDATLPDETVPVVFHVRLSNPSWQPISIEYLTRQVVDGSGLLLADSARAGLDYSAVFETVPGLLTIPAGQTEGTISISTIGDGLDEYDERFRVAIALAPGTPSSVAEIADDEATGIVLDDDATPFARWNIVSYSTAEGQAGNQAIDAFHILLTDEFGNVLPGGSGRPVTVSWKTAHGTAIGAAPAGSGELPDYIETFDSVTFQPGETDLGIEVVILGDTVAEPDEIFFVNLLGAVNARLDNTQDHLNHGTLTIANDESGDPGPWHVEFGSRTYSVTEGAGSAWITLARAAGSSEPTAVFWSVGGSATHGLDYTGIWENGAAGPRGTVYFAADETIRTFEIPIVDDGVYEGDETVVLFVRNPTGGAVRAPNKVAILTIHDNDPLPVVSIGNAHGQIGPDLPPGNFEGPGFQLEFDVTVTGHSSVPVTVDWAAYNGTAIAGLDFFPIGPVTLNFGTVNGTEVQTVKVTTVNDAVPEVTEHLYARLSNAVNAKIVGYEGEGNIADDDLATLHGFVFFDANDNGHFDADVDHPLPGVGVKLADFQGDHFAVTDSGGQYSVLAYLGSVTVTVDESTAPLGSEVSTGNNPQTVKTSFSNMTIPDVGFSVKPKPGKPVTSIGSGASFFGDTAYGGPGNDVVDGGGGDDWLVGGHWLGPGCACSGVPYSAILLRQDVEVGGRFYIDPATIPATGTLEGRVWLDANSNNLDTDGEAGVGGVQVNLFDSEWTLVATAWTTPGLGTYRFENLTACDYYVQFLPPSGFRLAQPDAGPNGVDSDAGKLTGLTGAVTVVGGVTTGDVDAGLQAVPPGSAGPWSLQFDRLVYSVRETDGFAAITVTRTPGSFEPAGVFLTTNGSATTPLDYLSTRSTLYYGAGEESKTLGIPVFNDGVDEGYETVILTLRNPTGGRVTGNLPTALLLIFDNPCPDDDLVLGGAGADTMLGDFGYFTETGSPVLLGGMGNDTLVGGTGADVIHGEGGADRIEGGANDDTLHGGGGNDAYLFDGDHAQGNDTLVEVGGLEGGNDTIDLSATANWDLALDLGVATPQVLTPSLTLTLPPGVFENVTGGARNDTLTGNDLNNVLDGRAGNDRLIGGPGNDRLIGGPGDDEFFFDADTGLGLDEIVEAANVGRDRIDFSGTTTQSVRINLGDVVAQAVNPNLGLVLSSASGIEDANGGALGDILVGNARDNTIQGGGGNDILIGGSGGFDTLLEVRAGNFTLTATTLSLGPETDLYAGFEAVRLVGDDTDNVLDASAFAGLVFLDGRGGSDTLIGGTGVNVLTGGTGSDVIDGSLGTSFLVEQRDADMTLTATQFVVDGIAEDSLSGIAFAFLTGGEGSQSIDASAFPGRAVLEGAGGDDVITGSAQSDILVGGAGNDLLRGGPGDDVYTFDADDDLGSDRIDELAGGGRDALDFSATATLGVSVGLGTVALQVVNSHLSLTLTGSDRIEDLRGGLSDDVLVGNGLPNQIEGLEGNDDLTGLSGNDVLDGGGGLNEFGKPFVDRVVESRDAHFVLANAALIVAGEFNTLAGIESAILTGGASNNILDASLFTAGSVILDGGPGNDDLSGGGKSDLLIGGPGNDLLGGGDGDDVYLFDADSLLDSDTVIELPGEGSDTLDYGATSTARISVNLGMLFQLAARTPTFAIRHVLTLSAIDVVENVVGGALEDTLTGNGLGNALTGGPGADWLTGMGGDDVLDGGNGDDVYFFDADFALGSDTITEQVGAGGNDTLNFAATTTQTVWMDLGRGIPQAVNPNLTLALITCHSIESVIGGALADILIGNSLDNRLEGAGGNDALGGRMGDDRYVFDVDGWLGSDSVSEQPDVEGGIDTLDFSATASVGLSVNLASALVQIVSAPNLSLQLGSGAAIENVLGGGQDDILLGNSLHNNLRGGAGNDGLRGYDGEDVLEGGAGNDTLRGDTDNDRYLFDTDSPLGTDVIQELEQGGVETLDFSGTTSVGISINLSLPGVQGVNGNLSLDVSGPNRIENVIGTSRGDTFRGNSLDNEFTGGAGDDRYFLDADGGLGWDTVYESGEPTGGVDTVSFVETTSVGIVLDMTAAFPQGVAADSTLTLSNPAGIEKLVGSAGDDGIVVVPLLASSRSVSGGAGGADVLSYDALGLATTQSPGLLSTVGFEPVMHDGFESVVVLNPAPSPVAPFDP